MWLLSSLYEQHLWSQRHKFQACLISMNPPSRAGAILSAWYPLTVASDVSPGRTSCSLESGVPKREFTAHALAAALAALLPIPLPKGRPFRWRQGPSECTAMRSLFPVIYRSKGKHQVENPPGLFHEHSIESYSSLNSVQQVKIPAGSALSAWGWCILVKLVCNIPWLCPRTLLPFWAWEILRRKPFPGVLGSQWLQCQHNCRLQWGKACRHRLQWPLSSLLLACLPALWLSQYHPHPGSTFRLQQGKRLVLWDERSCEVGWKAVNAWERLKRWNFAAECFGRNNHKSTELRISPWRLTFLNVLSYSWWQFHHYHPFHEEHSKINSLIRLQHWT